MSMSSLKTSSLRTSSLHTGYSDQLFIEDEDTNNVDDEALSSEQRNAKREINFLNDLKSTMTYGRVLALKLMKYNWYYPRGDEEDDKKQRASYYRLYDSEKGTTFPEYLKALSNKETKEPKPNLEFSWAFFEHVTLPRHIDYRQSSSPTPARKTKLSRCFCKSDEFEYAGPGESSRPTKMYSPLFTPLRQMGDFGLGYGLYFSTLFSIAVVTFIAAIINIPSLLFFSSEEYSSRQQNITMSSLTRGSAVCTDQTWVPCPSCDNTQFYKDTYRFVEASGTVDGVKLPFAVHNNCMPTFEQGMINLATVIFLTVAVFFLNKYSVKMEVTFDEDEQTAQDYSLHVRNPPEDASDPEEWKKFFKLFGHVTVCSIVCNNDLLLKSLVERREVCQALYETIPLGTQVDENELAKLAAETEENRSTLKSILLYIFPIEDVATLFAKFVVLTSKVRGLAQINHKITDVFITFETEAAQRNALMALSFPTGTVMWQKTEDVPTELLFKGKTLLDVAEAEEPTSIRWQEINSTPFQVWKAKCLTSVLCAIALYLDYRFVKFIWETFGVTLAASTISFANLGFTALAKLMTDLEPHPSESSKQTSMYFKICIFRWFNTAVIITILTPTSSIIQFGDDHLLHAISKIYFSEILTTTIIQIFDIGGNFKRHVLAPRSKNQRQADKQFEGLTTELAERYTNMTKIVFLTFFYCSIYPLAYFLCALALFINLYADSFSVMRTWQQSPRVGKSISRLSRKYFFTLCLVVLALKSAYFWAGFPYDNLCPVETKDDRYYDGEFELRALTVGNEDGDENPKQKLNITSNDTQYEHCSQYMLSRGGHFRFPPFLSFQPNDASWMSDDQKRLVQIYGVMSVVVTILVMWKFFFNFFRGVVIPYFRNSYRPDGQDMGIPFSSVHCIDSYIPQIKSELFNYPLIAADLSTFDDSLITWKDNLRGYPFYCLKYDVEDILDYAISERPEVVVFDVVAYWGPKNRKSKKLF